MGVSTSRATFAAFYINDIYWGLYLMIENEDKKFLIDNYNDHKGTLYH